MADDSFKRIEERTCEIGHIIGRAIDEVHPKRFGFMLMVFEYGEGGRLTYISSAQRDDVLAVLKEYIARQEGRYIERP